MSINLQTRYITLDDFQDYFGIDLRQELGGESMALGFLKRIENRMASFLNSNFNKNVDLEYPYFSDYQKEHYKLALLEQCIYIHKNSDVSVDSGYDMDGGEIISRGKIKQISIAPNAENELRLCGLWNRNLTRMGANGRWWFPL